jgi:hypothetical protein
VAAFRFCDGDAKDARARRGEKNSKEKERKKEKKHIMISLFGRCESTVGATR